MENEYLVNLGLNELGKSLAKAQSEMKPLFKQSDNPFFKSKYADLASVWESCREALTGNGLSIAQPTEVINGELYVVTYLIHASGQYLKGYYPIRPVKNDPQGFGSAITYGRRYALGAMVGVCPEDDDGNAASGKTPENQSAAKKPHEKPAAQVIKKPEQVDEAVQKAQRRQQLFAELNLILGELKLKKEDVEGITGYTTFQGITDEELENVIENLLSYKASSKQKTSRLDSLVTPDPLEEGELPF